MSVVTEQRTTGSPARGRRRVWVGAAVLIVLTTACGSQTSAKDLRALLNDGAGQAAPAASTSLDGSAAPAAEPLPTTAADPATGASGSRSSGPAASPGGLTTGTRAASAQPSSRAAGAQSAAAAGSSIPAPKTATGAQSAGGGGTAPGSPTGAPSAAGGPATCSGSEAPLIIGTVGTQSGVLGDVYHSAVKSLQVWVAKANAGGGINCHKVKHLVGDDGADPARHQALVRRFVEEEKVIAFVLNNAPVTGPASAEYLKQKQVPVIGQEGGQFFYYDSPVHFPVAASGEMLQRLTVAAGARVAVPAGKTKAALVTCQEVEYCNRADTVYPDQAKKSGLDVVYTVKATLTQPDYTAQCLGARNAGADVMMAVFDGNGLTRLTASCAKIGYHPVLVIVSNTSTSDHLKDPNMEGTVVSSPKRPWFLSDHKAVAEFQAAIKQYAPGLPIEASGIDGWQPGKAFEHIARRIAPNEAPTSKAILDSANSLSGDDIDGLVFPLTFRAGEPHKPIACGWAVVTGKGKFSTDGQMFCVPGYEL